MAYSTFPIPFKKGIIYGISAPSGKGKTTLLNLIGGILLPTEGEIHPTRHFGIATIFQQPQLLPHLTAEENIILPSPLFFTEEKARRIAQNTYRKWKWSPSGTDILKSLVTDSNNVSL